MRKKLLKVLKWLFFTILLLLLLVFLPIGVNKIYEKTRAAFLTDDEKRSEDVNRLAYLFKNQFSGYNVLPATRSFDSALEVLQQGVQDGTLSSDMAFNTAILKTVASFKDPHTTVYNKSELLDKQFPFTVRWSNGSFYLLSGKLDKEWIGAKVVKFGETPGEAVFDKLSAYTNAPNEAGTAYFISSFTSSADVLYQEGIISDPNSISLELSKAGESRLVSFGSISRAEIGSLPDYNTMGDKWGEYSLPLYKMNPEKNYWYTYDATENLLYLRYKMCVSQGDIESFWNEVFEKITEVRPGKFVIDVRGNPGGDTQNHSSFLSRIAKDTLVNKYGKLFTLIDRGTGSAAVSFASDMERITHTLLVGEKTMDTPNTTSDPTFFTLPHSGITLLVPSLYSLHSHVHDRRDAVQPDISIAQNIEGEAYLTDEVMDYIRKMKFVAPEDFYAQLPIEYEGSYRFSAIRNVSLTRKDSIWFISIDGLADAPIYGNDSTYYTRKYDMKLRLGDSSRQSPTLYIHNSEITLIRSYENDKSLVRSLSELDFEMAEKLLRNMKEGDVALPPYLDRPFFQSRTYAIYNEVGAEDAFTLNKLAQEFYPEDPVLSIVDYELYEYEDNSWGQIKSIFPVIGKLLQRYYTVIFSDDIMNDDYNAFIGR